jgi:alpha-glucosidase
VADFGEYLPFKSQLHAGSGEALHNLFPDYWASLQLEAVQEAAAQRRLASPGQEEEENDLLVFVRSGSLRTPGLAMCYWVGDQLVTWDKHDGMKTVLPAMLSGGLSGHSLTHSDIGGYTMIDHPVFKYFRPRELLYRWIEMGAFAGAVFRTHLGSFMHTPSAQVWDDAPTVAHFSRFARIFAALAPYRRTLMDEAWQKGWPLIRPLFLHHPDDRLAYHLDSQFLLGQDLLVAPVLDPGRSSARVYLPAVEGGWVHAWTSRLYGKGASKGEWVIVPAPLGQPPVFYRFDSPSKKVFELIVAQ